jgi:hypothetical protein
MIELIDTVSLQELATCDLDHVTGGVGLFDFLNTAITGWLPAITNSTNTWVQMFPTRRLTNAQADLATAQKHQIYAQLAGLVRGQ